MSPFDAVEGSLTQCPPADVPVIATLYDLIPLLHPERYLQRECDRTLYMSRIGLLRRADLLLAISESARQDAITHLGLNPSTVVNIGTGIDARFRPLQQGEERLERPFEALGLDGPYIMAVLGDDDRKNLSGLLKAMSRLPADVHSDAKFVVVGNYADERKVSDATLTSFCRPWTGQVPA